MAQSETMMENSYSILVIVLFSLSSSIRAFPATVDESVDRIWPIPQFDGSIRYMTYEQALIEAMLREPLVDVKKSDKIRFHLYTQDNPTVSTEIDIDNPDTLERSFFNPDNPTRFMIHGWNGVYTDITIEVIREALLLNGANKEYNFFSVDWSIYGASYTYVTSKNKVSTAGKAVAHFIDWLHLHTNMSFDTLAVYGISLGAHVAGFAGKYVQNGRIHTIVGMDPAMPLFSYNNLANRLSGTDAYYVESIQTNGGNLGFYQPIGQAAFYPNGGRSQPGCEADLSGFCSHGRSVRYFAEALSMGDKNGFNVVGCCDIEQVKDASCATGVDGIRLGAASNAGQAEGVYYLRTNAKSPFGLGVAH